MKDAMIRRLASMAALVVAALLLSACGGSGDVGEGASEDESPEPAAPSPEGSSEEGSPEQEPSEEASTEPEAAETIRLTLSHALSDSFPAVSAGINPFVEEVAEASNGQIEIEVSPGGQLGPGDLNVITNGLVDMALVSVIQPESPLAETWYLPTGMGTMLSGQTLWRALHEDSVFKAEWDELGVLPLMVTSGAPFQIATRDDPMPTLASLDGIRVRVSAGPLQKLAEAMGMEAVQIDPTEIFDAVQRGTVDGAFLPPPLWAGVGIDTLVAHSTANVPIGSPTGISLAISKETWDSLTSEQQTILYDAGYSAMMRVQEANVSDYETALEGEGVTAYEWAAEDLEAFEGLREPVIEDWVVEAEAKGLNARAAYEDLQKFRAASEDAPEDYPHYPVESLGQ